MTIVSKGLVSAGVTLHLGVDEGKVQGLVQSAGYALVISFRDVEPSEGVEGLGRRLGELLNCSDTMSGEWIWVRLPLEELWQELYPQNSELSRKLSSRLKLTVLSPAVPTSKNMQEKKFFVAQKGGLS